MVVEPFKFWWCCLNPRERNTLIALVVAWLTNPTYIGRASFDIIVTVSGENASIKMLDWFMLFYGLEYQLIPCGEDCFIDAVVFTSGLWAQLALFSTTDDFICTTPCKIRTFPE